MSNFVHARGVMAPFAMTLAAAAFLAAGTMTPPAYAQTATHAKPTAAKAATSMRPESVDQRIAQLRRELKITAAQEQDWQAVAQVMKSNADTMQNLVQQTRSEGPRSQRNALEDLQNYQKFAQAHADGLQKLTSAFATLYNSMTPEQKANADKVFREHEQRRG
jgi:periplasmic protein CpxP/Spy